MPVPTLAYRTDDYTKWGPGNGEDLDAAQIDVNFWNLKEAIETMTLSEGVGIDHFVMDYANSQFSVVLTNNVTIGPYDYPRDRWYWRGVWTPSTPYAVNDIFTVGSHLFIVLYAHTSELVFAAGANDGNGHNYYQEMLAIPEIAIPVGGSVRQIMGKASAADYDTGWQWPFQVVADVTAATYQLAATDIWEIKYCTNVVGTLVTIPLQATTSIPIGAEVILIQGVGAEAVSIEGEVGVTLLYNSVTETLTTNGEGAKVILQKIGTNLWVVRGDLITIPAVPAGGLTGQALLKASDADGDTTWGNSIPPGGLTDEILAKNSDTNGDYKWMALPASGAMKLVSGTYTAAIGDNLGVDARTAQSYINLPDAPPEGTVVSVTDVYNGFGTYYCTVQPSGTDVIDGRVFSNMTYMYLNAPGNNAVYTYDGAGHWKCQQVTSGIWGRVSGNNVSSIELTGLQSSGDPNSIHYKLYGTFGTDGATDVRLQAGNYATPTPTYPSSNQYSIAQQIGGAGVRSLMTGSEASWCIHHAQTIWPTGSWFEADLQSTLGINGSVCIKGRSSKRYTDHADFMGDGIVLSRWGALKLFVATGNLLSASMSIRWEKIDKC